MKITNSRVSMASRHELETHVSTKQAKLEVRAEDGTRVKNEIAALYEESGESAVSAVKEYSRKSLAKEQGNQRSADNRRRSGEAGYDRKPGGLQPCELRRAAQPRAFSFEMDEKSEMKIQLLNRLLEAIGGKGRVEPIRIGGQNGLDLRGDAARRAGMRSQMFGMSAFSYSESRSISMTAALTASGSDGGATAGTSSAGTLWRRINAVSTERTEREYTAFASKGCALTEDGRSISFNVEFAMSRAFTEKFDALSSETFMLTDPLVIQLDDRTPSVGDIKFRFDLDADGEEEEISFAGEGSGFLALDANGNGIIDDGSELFGTKSGDGFADLAAHDEDGNGWIDENDPAYSRLRVWVRDKDGGDRLLDLKEANVGAIFLGSAETEFSLKDAGNRINGVVRRTGVYLKETGEAGTISHIDLSC